MFRARDLLVRQRTQCINALRGHLAEYGYVVPQGITHVGTLIGHIEDRNTSLPESARTVLMVLVGTYRALDAQVGELGVGLCMLTKRLEQGQFAWPSATSTGKIGARHSHPSSKAASCGGESAILGR